ncbi:kinase-like protein, partial [Obba rivulosa]
HDHVVPCYGASITEDPPFVVLRYMRHGHLLRYLRLHPEVNRVQLLYEVSLGMRYLHEENVVHGDIKAVNILIDDAGKACVSDFGLSTRVQGSKLSKSKRCKCTAGTLRYMAPEAIKTGSFTCATDVYAYGMLIYEVWALLTRCNHQ